MPAYEDGKNHQRAGDKKRNPSAFVKLNHYHGYKNEACKYQTHAVYGDFLAPVAYARAHPPPVRYHPQLGQRKSYEHVYTVKHHEKSYRSARYYHHDNRGNAHDYDAVLIYEPVAQHCETCRQPPVKS